MLSIQISPKKNVKSFFAFILGANFAFLDYSHGCELQ